MLLLGELALQLTQKFAPYLRSLISHAEIGDSILCKDGKILADWLFEYAGRGAADAKEALKMLAQYTGAESLYDVAVRCNSGNLSEYVRNNANIASKLSKKVSGDVYAYDGNVAFGQTWSRPFKKYGKYEDRLSNIQKSYIQISLKNRWISLPQGKLKYKDGELYGKCDE